MPLCYFQIHSIETLESITLNQYLITHYLFLLWYKINTLAASKMTKEHQLTFRLQSATSPLAFASFFFSSFSLTRLKKK